MKINLNDIWNELAGNLLIIATYYKLLSFNIKNDCKTIHNRNSRIIQIFSIKFKKHLVD